MHVAIDPVRIIDCAMSEVSRSTWVIEDRPAP